MKLPQRPWHCSRRSLRRCIVSRVRRLVEKGDMWPRRPVFHLFCRCSPMLRISLLSWVVASGASIASRCQAPPTGAGGMVGVEVRSLPRPCRQLCGTAFSGSRQLAQSSKPAFVPGGRCWLELWGFLRPSRVGQVRCVTRLSRRKLGPPPPRPLAGHVLALHGGVGFSFHIGLMAF